MLGAQIKAVELGSWRKGLGGFPGHDLDSLAVGNGLLWRQKSCKKYTLNVTITENIFIREPYNNLSLIENLNNVNCYFTTILTWFIQSILSEFKVKTVLPK